MVGPEVSATLPSALADVLGRPSSHMPTQTPSDTHYWDNPQSTVVDHASEDTKNSFPTRLVENTIPALGSAFLLPTSKGVASQNDRASKAHTNGPGQASSESTIDTDAKQMGVALPFTTFAPQGEMSNARAQPATETQGRVIMRVAGREQDAGPLSEQDILSEGLLPPAYEQAIEPLQGQGPRQYVSKDEATLL